MSDVINGVPLPPRKPRKYPFDTMAVGGMFFVPGHDLETMAPYASRQGKKLGKKFSTRTIHARETIEGFIPCEPYAPGAILGIGVWRVE